MIKIVYVSVGRLTDKIARDWYIDHLIAKGAVVEYWDIVALVRDEHSEQGEVKPAYLHVVRSVDQLEALLCLPQNRRAYFVLLVSYAGQTAWIFRLFSRHMCRMVSIAWGAMPRDSAFSWRKVSSVLANPWWVVREIFFRTKATAFRRLKLVKPFRMVFAAGEQLMSGSTFAEKVVPINLCDYDSYVEAQRDASRLVSERYAVFLDINLPFQSDLAFCGLPAIEPGNYYKSLNRFFGLLERQYGIEVVIAAHPKARYGADVFEGRRMHRLMTAELVKNAEFVLSHTSTAMSYAVLGAKPLVFIYTDDMMTAYANTVVREIHCYADYLKAPVYNIDRLSPDQGIAVNEPDAACCEHYKYNFLTSRLSENAATRDILWREINIDDGGGPA